MQRATPGSYLQYDAKTKAIYTNDVKKLYRFLRNKSDETVIDEVVITADVPHFKKLVKKLSYHYVNALTIKGAKVQGVAFGSQTSLQRLSFDAVTFVYDVDRAATDAVRPLRKIVATINDMAEKKERLFAEYTAKIADKAGENAETVSREIWRLKAELRRLTNEYEAIKALRVNAATLRRFEERKNALPAHLVVHIKESDSEYDNEELDEVRRELYGIEPTIATLKAVRNQRSDEVLPLIFVEGEFASSVMHAIGSVPSLIELSMTHCTQQVFDKEQLLLDDSVGPSIMTGQSVDAFVAASLASGQKIQVLNFSKNNLSASHIHALSQLPAVEHLDISENPIGDYTFTVLNTQEVHYHPDEQDGEHELQFALDGVGVDHAKQKEFLPELRSLDADNTGLTNQTRLRNFQRTNLQHVSVEGNGLHANNCLRVLNCSAVMGGELQPVSTPEIKQETNAYSMKKKNKSVTIAATQQAVSVTTVSIMKETIRVKEVIAPPADTQNPVILKKKQ